MEGINIISKLFIGDLLWQNFSPFTLDINFNIFFLCGKMIRPADGTEKKFALFRETPPGPAPEKMTAIFPAEALTRMAVIFHAGRRCHGMLK
ncbi:MAG: hypothetical protein C6W57_10200 [Caldibacillus debilis]|nr:MAG: hypothetical protein C6W57_10200 [Caldibacillus debilis]